MIKSILDRIIAEMEGLKNNIKLNENKIIEEEKDIVSLNNALILLDSMDEVTKVPIKEKIVQCESRVKWIKFSSIEKDKEKLENLKITQRTIIPILQDMCKHEKRQFDHTDYHKGEDYYICLECDRIF